MPQAWAPRGAGAMGESVYLRGCLPRPIASGVPTGDAGCNGSPRRSPRRSQRARPLNPRNWSGHGASHLDGRRSRRGQATALVPWPLEDGLERLHRFLERRLEIVGSGIVVQRSAIPDEEQPDLGNSSDIDGIIAEQAVGQVLERWR
jgi:hypothetical protein